MYAGFAAIMAANVVVVAYVIMAFNEENGGASEEGSDCDRGTDGSIRGIPREAYGSLLKATKTD